MFYGVPEVITAQTDPISREFYDYYGTPRGQHPRSTMAHGVTSNAALILSWSFPRLNWISPRPVLFVMGEHAHSRVFSEQAYKLASEPKGLYIVPNAGHVDLYDKTNLIPWDKLTTFFNQHLV